MTGSSPTELERAFRATVEQGSTTPGATRRRLLPNSGLDVFTEVRFPARDWALLVQSSEPLEDRDLVLAAGLTCRTSNGCIEVVAGPETERQLFCTLLADLLAQLSLPGNQPAAALARRLTAWQRMLSRGMPGGMLPEERLGLYGELLVLRDLMLTSVGADAVAAWSGPSGAPQDFTCPPVALEVKTVSRQAPGSCRISNEHQLDTSGLGRLFLVYQVAERVPHGLSLGEFIDELRSHPLVRADLATFENSLLEYGWVDAYRSRYAQDRYGLSRRRYYAVQEAFPRLAASVLPLGISGVTYVLDMSACSSHEVDEETLRHSLGHAMPAAGR
ncbi:MAG TPA: PD-(D/E)XK motif protein [Trebonia sp.]|nr:PD-(D/E)XK motif protein [Trebonia sp.]